MMLLQLVVMLKAVVEVAIIAFVGQGILFVLAGANRERNIVYSLFRVVTSPVMRVGRALAPRFVLDQHVPFFALFLLLAAEAVLILAKIYLVLRLGSAPQ